MAVEAGFPPFYVSSDAYSRRWQKLFLRWERGQLLALVLAAIAANFGRVGLTVSAISFVVAVTCNICRFATKADRRWWSGRAGAESAKTLCWRYCVGGAPFEVTNTDSQALLASRLTDVAKSVNDVAPISIGASHITHKMDTMRASPLAGRIEVYRLERIADQMRWYHRKSGENDDLGRRWTLFSIACQSVGVVLAIVSVASDFDFDFIGVFSAVAASATAWLAVKQHDVLARSYAYASAELAQIDAEISARQWTEDDWGVYVDNAEEAISREHTAWRASRGT